MPAIDINADIGEGMPWDDELMEIVTSVNVGLGEHAGKWQDSLRTMEKARSKGLRVGFHPGYPDRENFGRRLPRNEDEECNWAMKVRQNLDEALVWFEPDYIKYHGALYHRTQDPNFSSSLLGLWMAGKSIPLMGMAGTAHEEMARINRQKFIREAFAERGYKDGKLIPRGEIGAELTDLAEIIAQAKALSSQVDSICIHGDREGCVEIARAVREALVG
ncbi:MAG: LamB/YcsF family protein [Chthonomonas sp.]|nr:LamB/YcsF family protein [Chthonomonas sp.]